MTRIAVSNDAASLWRLLLPDSSSLSSEETEISPVISDSWTTMHQELSPEARHLPTSLLWEVRLSYIKCCMHLLPSVLLPYALSILPSFYALLV